MHSAQEAVYTRELEGTAGQCKQIIYLKHLAVFSTFIPSSESQAK